MFDCETKRKSAADVKTFVRILKERRRCVSFNNVNEAAQAVEHLVSTSLLTPLLSLMVALLPDLEIQHWSDKLSF